MARLTPVITPHPRIGRLSIPARHGHRPNIEHKFQSMDPRATAYGGRARRAAAHRQAPCPARRLRQREDDYLRFTTDPRVPSGNYAAEREARTGKLRVSPAALTLYLTRRTGG